MERLEEFPMSTSILDVERNANNSVHFNEMFTKWISQKEMFRASEESYIGAYKQMVFFEEAADTIKTKAFNLTTVYLNRTEEDEYYMKITPGSEELCAAIDDKQLDRFTLKSESSEKSVDGKILRREADRLYVDLFTKYFRIDDCYNLFFQVNRMNYQLQHNALQFIAEHRLFSILINNPSYHSQSLHTVQSQWQSDDLQFTTNYQNELNIEQMKAVECIVNANYNPLPNLLYGPPGTGKTKTIVAAIETIVRTTTKNILVCAQSNAACNEIAERLAKVLNPDEMLRMFSMSYELDQISSTIEPFCNLFDGALKYPSLEYLYGFRVLICTLSTSGCLVRARISSNFDPSHFHYVFIDECASAHETMALIPIAGLCTSVGKVHANIVLIGDPKQLDAVTKSACSTMLGFKISWFERLFDLAMYKRHDGSGKFSETYITQLVRNYRSHRAILKVPNELFYENTLVAIAKPDHIRLEMEGLLSKTFPIIFKSVHGYCKKDDNGTSSFNMDEVRAVVEFVDELLKPDRLIQLSQSDIGVVSPYKLQCKIIRRYCETKGYKNITIGSAETFQGQERKVMIISSVRSGGKLGEFLSNPQRFNVMITRAKSLLIVVGNPHLLSQDENWSTFIRYCFKNKCLIQSKRWFRPKEH
ncbi:putative helicase mov-10-B.2 isoform X2 [Bradysia coprophila]|nr:putative helicase mov-10-B.2 isoform X2 [Bradysia coprophila]